MATGYTPLLGLAVPVTGELTDQWGDVVNDSITKLLEHAVAGQITFDVTASNWTLDDTGGGANNEARYATLIVTGTPNGIREIIAPDRPKSYYVLNKTEEDVIIKASGTTGAIIYARQSGIVVWNGADFEVVSGAQAQAIDGSFDLFDIDQTGWYTWESGGEPTNMPETGPGHARVTVLDNGDTRIDVYMLDSHDKWTTIKIGGTWHPWVRTVLESDYATKAEALAGVEDKKVISPLRLKEYTTGETLTNEDLDNVIEVGTYRQPDDGEATEGRNYPVELGGVLQVMLGATVTQTYIPSGVREVYIRSKDPQNIWVPWLKLHESMPVGSTYMQFPNQDKPEDLWGGVWTPIHDSDGVFFRTEGGEARSFGDGIQTDEVKQHNHSASTNSTGAHTHSGSTGSTNTNSSGGNQRLVYDGAPSSGERREANVKLASSNTGHTHSFTTNSAGAHSHTVTVDNTGGAETRPRNITVRIWLRTA